MSDREHVNRTCGIECALKLRGVNRSKSYTPEQRLAASISLKNRKAEMVEASRKSMSRPDVIEKIRNAAMIRAESKSFKSHLPELLKAGRDARRRSPLCQKDENNGSAKSWSIRSPSGIVYEFKNLRNFLRNNVNLFDSQDVAWFDKKMKRNGVARIIQKCLAEGGIRSICPRNKNSCGSWKGWTWHSDIVEKQMNYGDDLLGRVAI